MELEELLIQHRTVLERYVHYRMQDHMDADDVVQNTMMTAMTHFHQLRDRRLFKPWLLKIAENQCRMILRNGRNDVSLDSLEQLPEIAEAWDDRIRSEVADVLDQMPRESAVLLRRFYLEGWNQQEIAQSMNIPLGTVKSRLYTARALFRRFSPPELRAYKNKGGDNMNPTKNFTEFMPTIRLTKLDRPFFEVKSEEEGFAIAKVGFSQAEATYRYPEKKLALVSTCTAERKARIHEVDCVQITRDTYNCRAKKLYKNESIWFTQLTEHYRRDLGTLVLGEDEYPTEIFTFLEEDYDIACNGEDRVNGTPLLIRENPTVHHPDGSRTLAKDRFRFTDGVWKVQIGEREFICIKVDWVQRNTYFTETFLDEAGRMVLLRWYETMESVESGFNASPERVEKIKQNPRVTVNGEEFVLLEDRFSEYVL